MSSKQREGSTQTVELDALAAIYRRAIERYEQEKAVGATNTDGDDTKARSVDDFRANNSSLPR